MAKLHLLLSNSENIRKVKTRGEEMMHYITGYLESS